MIKDLLQTIKFMALFFMLDTPQIDPRLMDNTSLSRKTNLESLFPQTISKHVFLSRRV